jgi:hypothetical protein
LSADGGQTIRNLLEVFPFEQLLRGEQVVLGDTEISARLQERCDVLSLREWHPPSVNFFAAARVYFIRKLAEKDSIV